MSLHDRDRRLRRIKLLLSHKLLQPYPSLEGDPTQHGVVFFGEIPDELLVNRQEAIKREESFREWLLLSEELLGSEWLAELDDDYGVSVIFVDDLNASRAALLEPQGYEASSHPCNGGFATQGNDLWVSIGVEPAVVHSGWPLLQTDETSLAQAQASLAPPLLA